STLFPYTTLFRSPTQLHDSRDMPHHLGPDAQTHADRCAPSNLSQCDTSSATHACGGRSDCETHNTVQHTSLHCGHSVRPRFQRAHHSSPRLAPSTSLSHHYS